jgi:hypothetical protein
MPIRWSERALAALFRVVNRSVPWYRLPYPLALANLVALRTSERLHNLYGTDTVPPPAAPPDEGFDFRRQRTADGSRNDLAAPGMGMAHTRFGRNVPIPETHGEQPPALYEPNPRLVSNRLLARDAFVPAPTLNVLVPAWLQFMVHDWLSHGRNQRENPHAFPVPEGDDWPKREMTILRTSPDLTRRPEEAGRPETYLNIETHWWDGSQIYGSSQEAQARVRSDPETGRLLEDGKLWLDRDGHLPLDRTAEDPDQELAGVNGNWWIGLSLMHTLFAREHNSIVDRLRLEHPDRAEDGAWLFHKARLVNAALIAKIHTTEWTPALLDTPELRTGMRGNWWGALEEHYANAFGRKSDSEALSGIPGSPQDHHTAPYAMTEEFTAVYRMHPLMPDEFSFRRRADDAELRACGLGEVAFGGARRLYAEVAYADAFYSLATSNAGALVLHNFPRFLRKIPEKPEAGIFSDLAAIDILRDRERGVPRYCRFRELLGMSVPASFAELTDNLEWRRQLEEIYGSVDKVDHLVGMLAETPPPGFAFSDTAFRIFILMASRRLKSDRFFTDDFTPEVYTPAGMTWIRDNGMRTVLLRHLPELAPHVADVRNLFFPWERGKG